MALSPLMFGASSTLLNANHYDVYFKGMPSWNGKVSIKSPYLRCVSVLNVGKQEKLKGEHAKWVDQVESCQKLISNAFNLLTCFL